jgi:hypothetical protein
MNFLSVESNKWQHSELFVQNFTKFFGGTQQLEVGGLGAVRVIVQTDSGGLQRDAGGNGRVSVID